jgi:hypothetical protein
MGKTGAMSDPVTNDVAPLGEVRRRRERLLGATLALEDALSAPAGGRTAEWTALVAERADLLRRALVEHIDLTEDDDGLFEDVVDRAPRLQHAIDALRHDHDTLLQDLDAARANLTATPTAETVDAARVSLHDVITLVFRHRSRGADLLYEAYSVDISVGD